MIERDRKFRTFDPSRTLRCENGFLAKVSDQEPGFLGTDEAGNLIFTIRVDREQRVLSLQMDLHIASV